MYKEDRTQTLISR